MTARGLFRYFHVVWITGAIQLYKYTDAGDVPKLLTRTMVLHTQMLHIREDHGVFQLERPQDLATAVPELFRNFTISSFLLEGSPKNVTTCTLGTTLQVYQYNPTGLVVAYGVAVAFSVLCVLWGIMALRANGTPVGKIFSQIWTTTRNDGIRGNDLGDMKVKLETVGGRTRFVTEKGPPIDSSQSLDLFRKGGYKRVATNSSY